MLTFYASSKNKIFIHLYMLLHVEKDLSFDQGMLYNNSTLVSG